MLLHAVKRFLTGGHCRPVAGKLAAGKLAAGKLAAGKLAAGKLADGKLLGASFLILGLWLSAAALAQGVQLPLDPATLNPLSLDIIPADNSSGGAALDGFVTSDLVLNTADQLASFQLYLELQHGQIYQDPMGGTLAPAGGLAELGFPSLRFDTFVAVGTETAAGPYGTPGLAGGAVDFGAAAEVAFDDDLLSVTWYGTPGEPMFGFEDFLLSRISLSADAIGSWGLQYGTSQGTFQGSGSIENGLLAQSWHDWETETDLGTETDVVPETNVDTGTGWDMGMQEDVEADSTAEIETRLIGAGTGLIAVRRDWPNMEVLRGVNFEWLSYTDAVGDPAYALPYSFGPAPGAVALYDALPFSATSSSAAALPAAVPEPNTCVIAISALIHYLLRRQHSSRFDRAA